MALVSVVTERVQTLLGDVAQVRYPDAELLGYIGEAYRHIAHLVPEATASLVRVTPTAASSRVALAPATEGWKVLEVQAHATQANPYYPGKGIPLVEIGVLNDLDPDWRSYVPSAGALAGVTYDDGYYQAWAYDPRDAGAFWLYPQPQSPTPVAVWVLASALPADPTAVGNTFALGDQFIAPVVDYTVYRALQKEGRYSVEPQIAASYYERFLQSLGLVTQVRKQDNPQAVKPPGGP